MNPSAFVLFGAITMVLRGLFPLCTGVIPSRAWGPCELNLGFLHAKHTCKPFELSSLSPLVKNYYSRQDCSFLLNFKISIQGSNILMASTLINSIPHMGY